MHIRLHTLCLLALLAAVSSCAWHNNNLEGRAKVSYYDMNGDGRVDLEKHQHPGIADADWELRDDDNDGRYEKKVLFGVGIIESSVDLPVPTQVHIETKP